MGRWTLRLALLGVLVLVVGGCDWPMFGYGPNHDGFNNTETKINTANVSSLTELFMASVDTSIASFSPAVANGEVYVGTSEQPNVMAFDATGKAYCSGTPKTCSPLRRSAFCNRRE